MLGNGATLFSCCLLSLGLLETLQKLTGMAAKILMLKTLKRLVYLVGLCVQIFLQGFAHCCLIALFLLLVHAQHNSCLCLCRCLWHFKLLFFRKGVSRTDAFIYLYFGFFILCFGSGQYAVFWIALFL